MACCCRNEQWPSLPLLSWPRNQSCSSSTASQKPDGYGKLQMELEWLKKVSAALMPVNYANWSIMTTLSSRSAASASSSSAQRRQVLGA